MFTTAHRDTGSRDRHHRSAVTIAVLALALAATTALLLLRILSGPTAAPGHGPTAHSSTGHSAAAEPAPGHGASRPSPVPPLQRINEGCSIAHFGVPC